MRHVFCWTYITPPTSSLSFFRCESRLCDSLTRVSIVGKMGAESQDDAAREKDISPQKTSNGLEATEDAEKEEKPKSLVRFMESRLYQYGHPLTLALGRTSGASLYTFDCSLRPNRPSSIMPSS